MAKCEFCDKGVTFGIKVSHSHRRSNRPWKPNVKRVKAIINGDAEQAERCMSEHMDTIERYMEEMQKES